jgi:hypothetical protein
MGSINYMDGKTFRDEGYLQEANRLFFHPLGLALEVATDTGTLKVWDYRDDPEGITFEKIDLQPKAEHIAELEGNRYATRKKAVGYWIQPVRS